MDVVKLPSGREVGVHGQPATSGGLTVFWHHGTPGTGAVPPVALPRSNWSWAGVDRPGYGASQRVTGRSVAQAAGDVSAIADHWGLERFAVVGYSGGGPHALAVAGADARVQWAVTVSSLAPRDADGLAWFEGMVESGVEALEAAQRGEQVRREVNDDAYNPQFTASDMDALGKDCAWLGAYADAASPYRDGAIDDDLAYVRDWGVPIDEVTCPVIAVHGGADGIAPVAHSRWLIKHLHHGYLIEQPRAGHISALTRLPYALNMAATRSERLNVD